jgi:hypothetical protein
MSARRPALIVAASAPPHSWAAAPSEADESRVAGARPLLGELDRIVDAQMPLRHAGVM